MNRPPDATFFAREIESELRRLENVSDVLAVGYLKAMYHLAATYGVLETRQEMIAAASRIYQRLKKDDSIRVHYFISVMMVLPSLCEPRWIPELETIVAKLGLPCISQDYMRCMKSNVEAYQREKEGEPDGTDNSGATPLRV